VVESAAGREATDAAAGGDEADGAPVVAPTPDGTAVAGGKAVDPRVDARWGDLSSTGACVIGRLEHPAKAAMRATHPHIIQTTRPPRA